MSNATEASIDNASVDDLKASFRGEIIRPVDPGTMCTARYGTARSTGIQG